MDQFVLEVAISLLCVMPHHVPAALCLLCPVFVVVQAEILDAQVVYDRMGLGVTPIQLRVSRKLLNM